MIEVATFRSGNNGFNDDNLVTDQSGKIIRDNVWGTLEEDTYRRDFTINALYYCPITGKIEDYNKGLKHIHNKEIVSIGDPDLRFEEDPVRSLRAIRFCTKLNFKISNNIKEAVSNAKPGQVEIRNDKDGNIGLSIGKKSFSDDKLIKNFSAVIETLEKEKSNSNIKGNLIISSYATSSMGISYKIKLDRVI